MAEKKRRSFGAGGIDDGAARHLADQSDDAADRQHQSDLDLGPFLRRQIDRDERAEAGLDVGKEEDEPVETALALRRAVWLGWRRHQGTRRSTGFTGRRRRPRLIGKVLVVWVRARDQG